jgi:hypothetical protein
MLLEADAAIIAAGGGLALRAGHVKAGCGSGFVRAI